MAKNINGASACDHQVVYTEVKPTPDGQSSVAAFYLDVSPNLPRWDGEVIPFTEYRREKIITDMCKFTPAHRKAKELGKEYLHMWVLGNITIYGRTPQIPYFENALSMFHIPLELLRHPDELQNSLRYALQNKRLFALWSAFRMARRNSEWFYGPDGDFFTFTDNTGPYRQMNWRKFNESFPSLNYTMETPHQTLSAEWPARYSAL